MALNWTRPFQLQGLGIRGLGFSVWGFGRHARSPMQHTQTSAVTERRGDHDVESKVELVAIQQERPLLGFKCRSRMVWGVGFRPLNVQDSEG